MTNPFQENIQLASSKITTTQTTVDSVLLRADELKVLAEQMKTDTLNNSRVAITQAENAASAAKAMAMNKLNDARGTVENVIAAIPRPKLPDIPRFPSLSNLPQLPPMPQIPPVPNLAFSIPSGAAILKKMLPKVTLPSFKFGMEVPKFNIPRPDWKGPAKIQLPKLPPGIG